MYKEVITLKKKKERERERGNEKKIERERERKRDIERDRERDYLLIIKSLYFKREKIISIREGGIRASL